MVRKFLAGALLLFSGLVLWLLECCAFDSELATFYARVALVGLIVGSLCFLGFAAWLWNPASVPRTLGTVILVTLVISYVLIICLEFTLWRETAKFRDDILSDFNQYSYGFSTGVVLLLAGSILVLWNRRKPAGPEL